VTDAMAAGLRHAAESLRAAGATVDPFPLDRLVADLTAAHAVVLRFEIRTERAAELAIADQLGERWTRLRDDSSATTLADYESAQRAISAELAQITATLNEYDAIVGPGATGAAPEGLEFTGEPVMSLAWQALRMPAVGVPGLRDDGGLPLGLQVVGRDELGAIRAGAWVEQHLVESP
jgi:Asp-tRNA(Asn)/Glu-tRNA(Gln) amidotransferase A subunit family amidase